MMNCTAPNTSLAFLLVHVPKTSGTAFQGHYVYGSMARPALLAGSVCPCSSTIDSHWPRAQLQQLGAPGWKKLASGGCNFVAAHAQAGHVIPVVSALRRQSFTFTFLREPVQRALSILSYGCRQPLELDGTCRQAHPWVPPAVRLHGLQMCASDRAPDARPGQIPSRCMLHRPVKREGASDEGPLWGSLQTWFFQKPDAIRSTSVAEISPNSDEAQWQAQAQLQALDAVLLTEHMGVSICYFYFRAGFSARFNAECRGRAIEALAKRAGNVSPHGHLNTSRLPNFQLYEQAIEGDKRLYRFGVKLFCQQVLAMEAATGVLFGDEARGGLPC